MSITKQQQYLTIGKTAKCVDIEPHILRYWEKKIPQLKPVRINKRRFYTQDHVDLLMKLKVLIIDQHHTLEGSRQKLFGRNEQNVEIRQALNINHAFKNMIDSLSNLLEELV